MINYETLSDYQLLSELIAEREGECISERLLETFPAIQYVLIDSTEEELLKIKGIGSRRIRQIKACCELARRLYTKDTKQGYTIKSADDVSTLLMSEMRYLRKEQFRLILLNTKNGVIEVKTISEGSLNSSIVHPREVFASAVRRSCNSIICVHNHPSGDPEPSREDVETTQRLIKGGEILGIKILDHVIIGNGKYLSLKEKGII